MARKLLYAKKLFADTLILLADPKVIFIHIRYIGGNRHGRTNHILRDDETKKLTWCGIRKKDTLPYATTLPNSKVCTACVREIMTPPLKLVYENLGEPRRKERDSG